MATYIHQLDDTEGFILVGGLSSRMGTDKARMELAGQTFAERIEEALSCVIGRIRIVGAKKENAAHGLPFVPDVYTGWGALGGVHAALEACREKWALIVACDLPFVSAELFARLADLRENFDIIAPVQSDMHTQPLCAFYRASVCRNAAQTLIEQKERRVGKLLERVRTRRVLSEEFADLKDAAILLMNVNTPEEYAQARGIYFSESTGEGSLSVE